MMREGHHFVSNEAATSFVNRNMISPDEVDVVLLVMLRNARRVLRHLEARHDLAVQYDWLETMRGRYLMQVFVDEATDLSAVQLACTIELANPDLRSWFACGDLRQRVTATGIRNEAEIEWLNRTTGVRIDIRKIDIGFRQSRKLRDFSDALATLLDKDAQKTKPLSETEEADDWPILAEHLSGPDLGQWLAARIDEVEKAIGWLPSIAVFVDGDDLIDPLLNVTQGALAQRTISIVGCKEGRVVGDASEVRVFDIQHIKGLEFEAVFFIGIDGLAQRLPDLYQRFLYVGVTRAATYLGVTCERGLPKLIEPLRPHFGMRGDWAGP
jgi:superfamily I DNA/RNA helicase